MLRRRRRVATVILLVLITAMTVPEAAFAQSAVAAPRPIPMFAKEQIVGNGCAVEQTVFLSDIRSLAGFEGGVNLTLVDLPKGVTGFFVPNPLVLRGNDNYTMLIVNAAHDVPLGKYILHIRLVPLPDSNYGAWGVEDNSLLDTNVTLDVVHPCIDSPLNLYNSLLPTSTTTTTTLFGSTSTTTVTTTTTIQAVEHPPLPQVTTTTSTTTTTTTTLTSISTERVTDSSTYAWAVSATVAAVVLAVVLMLQRRRK